MAIGTNPHLVRRERSRQGGFRARSLYLVGEIFQDWPEFGPGEASAMGHRSRQRTAGRREECIPLLIAQFAAREPACPRWPIHSPPRVRQRRFGLRTQSEPYSSSLLDVVGQQCL